MGVQSPDRMDVDAAKPVAAANGGIIANTGASSPVGGDVARSDVSLPKRERRRSFLARNQKIQALKDLPNLKDTSLQRREVGGLCMAALPTGFCELNDFYCRLCSSKSWSCARSFSTLTTRPWINGTSETQHPWTHWTHG